MNESTACAIMVMLLACAIIPVYWAFKMDEEHQILKYLFVISAQAFMFITGIILSKIGTLFLWSTDLLDTLGIFNWLVGFTFFVSFLYSVAYLLIKMLRGLKWANSSG